MQPVYMNGKGVAKISDVVMIAGNVRAVVIAIDGTFVKVRAIGTHIETGEKIILGYVHDLPASECVFLGYTDPDVIS